VNLSDTGAGRFVLFGTGHLFALGATAGAAVLLARIARTDPDGLAGRAVRLSLAALLLGGTATYLVAESVIGVLSVWDFAPLHLCDMAIFVAAWALITRQRAASELAYFWACAATVLAMITPDVAFGFPDWRCVSFFGLHGAVVVAAVVLPLGLGLHPRRGAAWRALLLTNLYAGLVGLVNVAFGTNYLFLCEKPVSATLLDWLGPWPWYLVVCEAIAVALFLVLELPFRVFNPPWRRP
jgi:hypothetical integral membrane protein (TIGR02206 family)